MSYCYINGQFVKSSEACVSINDLGFLRSFSVFDFFRTSQRIPLFLESHFERLKNASIALGLDLKIAENDLRSIVRKLISLVDFKEIGFKIIVTGGESKDGFYPSTPNIYIIAVEVNLPSEEALKGLHLKLLNYSRESPSIKTVNYLEAIKHLSTQPKNEVSFDDVLYYTDDKFITETSRANFYMVKNNIIYTTKTNILPGVTRQKVLEIAKKEVMIELRDISVSELFEADECFISSTTKRVLPITRIDDKIIGNGELGPVTKGVLSAFIENENEYIKRQKTLNTSVISVV